MAFRLPKNLDSEKKPFALPLINLQKTATCASIFAPLKGQVCAKGVHEDPCKNSKKWLLPLFRLTQSRPLQAAFLFAYFVFSSRLRAQP